MAKSPERAIGPTSYSILGLLALRSWTAYELTKQMGRTLHHFWPRAESGIYREIKRLVDRRLAVADTEAVGRRSRTRYTITDEGRIALGSWLATPHEPGLLESEALVRILLGDQGTKDDLLVTMQRMAEEADELRTQMVTLVRHYAGGTGEFPERSHINHLVAKFLLDLSDLVSDFTRYGREVVTAWPDTAGRPPDEATMERLRELIQNRSTGAARASS